MLKFKDGIKTAAQYKKMRIILKIIHIGTWPENVKSEYLRLGQTG